MPRTYAPKLTTTQRGYGHKHQKARRAYVEAFRSGDPCARCGDPMVGDASLFDLDHTDDRTGYLGLSHRECNRSVQRKKMGGRTSVCDHCGLEYRARWADQVYCGVACQKAARAVKAMLRKTLRERRVVEVKPCVICWSSLTPTRCCASVECRVEYNRRSNRDRYRAAHGLPVDFNEPTSVWLKVQVS